MPVIESNAIAPNKAYAYHQTAYVPSLQAPAVPYGAPSGFTAVEDGYAIRLVQVMDSNSLNNIVAADACVGDGPVLAVGSFDEKGVWVPCEYADDSASSGAGEETFVRCVALTVDEESSSS